MKNLSKEYPEYGFEKHKGYGTKEHIEALKKIGPCIYHRLSFLKYLSVALALTSVKELARTL
mgnify:CR=1 FL=1